MLVSFPSELPPASYVFSLGVFDGVHVGHQAIFRQLTALAHKYHSVPVALFFSPSPKQVLTPLTALKNISGAEQNLQLIRNCGIETFVKFPFSRELAALSPEEFMERFFWQPNINVKAFCVGENWRFGHKNQGNGNTLSQFCTPRQIETVIVPSVVVDGETVSSTRIRLTILAGNIELVNRLLGHPYAFSGTVSHGRHLGTSLLDYPTANLSVENRLLPPFGVYAARGRLDASTTYDGIAYLGDAPTIRTDGSPEIILELHLFDFHKDIYDIPLDIELYSYLRPSIKFASSSALQQQISLDIQKAKTILASLE